MEARINWRALRANAIHVISIAALLGVSMGARYRSANFVVDTADPNFARQVAETAEKCRHDLAVSWLGEAMPNWSQPCAMTVQAGPGLGAGGATSFTFDRGEVFGWVMSIQGSQARILDSVLPHEITHMIFASHFRQPLPRWADEGGATSVEHSSERNKHRQMLHQFLRTNRGIPFNQMFAMTEYPQDIMPLYAQGYALAEYLIQNGGRRKFLDFVGDGLQSDDWPGAVARHYGIRDLNALQNTWLAWVRQGMPNLTPPAANPTLVADARRPRPAPNLIFHVRDHQGTPARLVSVQPPQPSPYVPLAASPAAAPGPFTPLPQLSADRIATAETRPATVLPTAGWHRVGEPAPVLAATGATAAPGPYSTQVTHPQAIEQAGQTLLR